MPVLRRMPCVPDSHGLGASCQQPWHVLGEEASAGGQARYVDSSVERLQVLAEGFVDERYKVVCNGYEVPMPAVMVSAQKPIE